MTIEDLMFFDSQGAFSPITFDSHTLLTKTLALVDYLNKGLSSEAVKYWLDQDSTRFAGIRIPSELLGATGVIDIDVSCYGEMALISGSAMLSIEAQKFLHDAVAIAGLRLLPEETADQPYTGAAGNTNDSTWRHRFFDYY